MACWIRRVAWLGFVAGCLCIAMPSSACTIPGPEPHTTSPNPSDTTPPAQVTDVGVSIQRGRGPERSGCSESATSCDGIGMLRIHIATPPQDDHTPSTRIGYLLRLAAGSLPKGVSLPTQAIRSSAGDELAISWSDDATDEQEALDFELTLTPVDEAGNEGPVSGPIVVRHGGTSEGCVATRGSVNGGTGVALVLLFAWGFARRMGRTR